MKEYDDIDQLIALIFSTGRLMRKRAQDNMKEPISLLQLEALRFVDEQRSPSMRQIAQFLCIAAPSATSLVEDLVRRGYLERVDDPSDRRVVRLVSSAKGKRVLRTHLDARMAHMRKTFGVLTPQERGQLASILSKLSNQR